MAKGLPKPGMDPRTVIAGLVIGVVSWIAIATLVVAYQLLTWEPDESEPCVDYWDSATRVQYRCPV